MEDLFELFWRSTPCSLLLQKEADWLKEWGGPQGIDLLFLGHPRELC